jgi:uncharacterized membrane protein
VLPDLKHKAPSSFRWGFFYEKHYTNLHGLLIYGLVYYMKA